MRRVNATCMGCIYGDCGVGWLSRLFGCYCVLMLNGCFGEEALNLWVAVL